MELRSYGLVIEAGIDDYFASAFKGMALKREAGITIVTGPVSEQADRQGCYGGSSDWA